MPLDSTALSLDVSDRITTGETVILKRLHKLLSDPKKWRQGKEKSGFLWFSRFCIVGGTRSLEKKFHLDADSHRILNRIAIRHGYQSAAVLNDDPSTTHDFILKIINEAINESMTKRRK